MWHNRPVPLSSNKKEETNTTEPKTKGNVAFAEDHKDESNEVGQVDSEMNEKMDDEKEGTDENAEPEETKPVNEECKKPEKKRKCCSKQCCKALPKTICPYFPRCCHLPLQTCLQLLAVTDLLVTFVNIGIWIYFHQYDPFTHNRLSGRNKTDLMVTTTAEPHVRPDDEIDISEFHETTTSIYGKEVNYLDAQGDAIKYSKIGYVYKKFQQEVENMCGRKYYNEYLFGHSLTITNGVFLDLLTITYLSEFMYQFIDISILATTCCFFEYTSGRLFLIVIWNIELLPVLAKLYIIVESRSHRLCILQYGLGKTFRGLDALLLIHFIPMILFRFYKLIVFTYFVGSMLELGNLEHQTRIQGATLHEYVNRHEEYLRMDKNRDKSSSEDEDVDNV